MADSGGPRRNPRTPSSGSRAPTGARRSERATEPTGRTGPNGPKAEATPPEDVVAAPVPSAAAADVAAGPTTASVPTRAVEAPIATPGVMDATAPTSGMRSGPEGSKAGPGGTEIRNAEVGGSTTAAPTMTGPTGASTTTERVGDPGAGSAATGAQAGTAAGLAVGAGLLGPVGAAAAVPVAAAAGALARAAQDEMPPEPGPAIVPGGGGTGPEDPIYDVARILRRLAERQSRE